LGTASRKSLNVCSLRQGPKAKTTHGEAPRTEVRRASLTSCAARLPDLNLARPVLNTCCLAVWSQASLRWHAGPVSAVCVQEPFCSPRDVLNA